MRPSGQSVQADGGSLAASMMDRLRREASSIKGGSAARLGTLQRLEIACDDLLSGEAFKLAKSANVDFNQFHPGRKTLTSVAIGRYIKLRARIDGAEDWPGPNAVTIRRDPGLMQYVRQREIEAFGDRRRSSPRTSKARLVEEVVASISPFDDQSLIREALEEGLAARQSLNSLLAALRRIPGLSIDQLFSGEKYIPPVSVQPPLDNNDRIVLRELLTRLTGGLVLEECNLRYSRNRLKLAVPPSVDLVYPEEFSLLRRLAGWDEPPPA